MQSQRPRPSRRLLSQLPAVVWERDANTGAFTFVNEAAVRLLGLPVEAWLDAPGFWEERILPEDREAVRNQVQARLKTGGFDLEYRVRNAAGEVVWVRDMASMSLGHGRFARVFGLLVDVTARRRAEDALAGQEARLRRQNRALQQLALCAHDLEQDPGRFIAHVTEADAGALGVERVSVWSHVEGAIRCMDLYTASTRRHEKAPQLAYADSPAYFEALCEARIIDADDARADPRTAELSTYLEGLGIRSILDAPVRVGQRIVGVLRHEHVGEVRPWTVDEKQFASAMADLISLAIELRAHSESETALRWSEARTEAVVHASQDPILLVDRSGMVKEANLAAEKAFRRTRDELLGSPATTVLLACESRPALAELLSRPPDSEGSDPLEVNCARGDGTEFTAEVWVFALPTEGADRTAVLLRDITRVAHVRASLREARRREDESVDARTSELRATVMEMERFSYTVAHDLRAPIRAIDAFSQLLDQECGAQLGPSGAHHLARIRRAAARMGHIVDDLLLLSRLAGAPLQREPVDLSEIAASVVAELREGEPARKVSVELEPDLVVSADPRLTRTLLENLLGNAWKFTSRHPTARIALGSSRDGNDRVSYVRDDGAGFDPTYLDRLFQPFSRLHGTTDFEGSGIGLAIVQRIVDRHGGRVWAEGQVEKGATFFFALPERPAPAEPAARGP